MHRKIVTIAAPALFALVASLPMLYAGPAAAQTASPAPRVIQQFTAGWRFLQADAPGAEKPTFDDSSWTSVTLPHDWAIAGPIKQDAPTRGAGAFMPAGIGWYRKSFTVPAADTSATSARRTFVVFDGVMANSDVYLNGVLLGHRPYGYVSFVYELTPALRAGQNVIAVRVDNSQQPASRWYPGAGINREVRLVTTGDTHIVPWGTFVTTPEVSAASATIHVRSSVINESAAPASVSLSFRIVAPDGQTILTNLGAPNTLAPGATSELSYQTTIRNPDRWDIGHGAMYTVRATVMKNGKAVDDEVVPFGIREFHFDPDQGFFLNGVHHKLNGVALHMDAGALGTAVPLAAWERRLTELRKLGVNAIRTAHDPPAPEFLSLADRMGFMVMDEMFDCWDVGKNQYDYHIFFDKWSVRDTADTVQRDRNHPSIILYSAGNEIHDTPRPELAIPILKSLVATFHQYDPTRPVTQALFRPNASHDYEDGLADLLDVVGQNYRPDEILAAHKQKPTRKIVGTENTHEVSQWVPVRDNAAYSGEFLWAGIDYLGEGGAWPTIGSGSGLIRTTGLTRARSFERQSWWTTAPMVSIARRVAVVRPAAVDPGYANATTTNQAADGLTPLNPAAPQAAGGAGAARPPRAPVAEVAPRFTEPLATDWTPKDLSPHPETLEIYTNAEEVELLLNGRSLGTQKLHPDATPILYKVGFEPGTLKAVARTGGKVVATEELRTAGKPARLVFTPELNPDAATRPLTPEWNDVRYVTATLVDDAGERIPDSTTLVHFSAAGPASIIGVDNGNLVDHEPFLATERTLYDGNAVAILRATGTAGATGRVTVTATADGVAQATITLTTAPVSQEDPTVAKAVGSERSF